MAKKFDKERKLHKKYQEFSYFCGNCTKTGLTISKTYVSIKASYFGKRIIMDFGSGTIWARE